MLKDKKPRPPRSESNHFHIEDETSHLWAVSYADFLMVLLSFFILFFSLGEEKKKSIIQTIATMGVENGAVSGFGDGSGENGGLDGAADRKINNLPTLLSLKELLDKFQLQTTQTEESLILKFPQNIYQQGEVQLSAVYRSQLKSLLETLRPFVDQIEITFIGHTDSSPLKKNKSELIADNFDLSVLRATKALQLALRQNINPDRLAAKGSAYNQRNSRTLSIILRNYSRDGINE